ncbi:unnamed protein product [Spirodela intermedia]|uniref:DNA-directed RNA polymerase n=1 Tax=Spirodela intermedia TaxID=51605 RepID=A0A7I8IGK2_SPIIN|nr:unnamed protein product [Spirodela intermedia]CAA6656833.1 unnamed protein product [Spirodela intermedia]
MNFTTVLLCLFFYILLSNPWNPLPPTLSPSLQIQLGKSKSSRWRSLEHPSEQEGAEVTLDSTNNLSPSSVSADTAAPRRLFRFLRTTTTALLEGTRGSTPMSKNSFKYLNVGQIFECSLSLAGDLLNRRYRIAPFDERYEQEASRKLVFSELYEASKQTKNPWVFEPEFPGKSKIFDGRTGDPFEQPVLVGKSYILKLIHQVDDKIHGRSTGHYALVTQQPLRGRAKQGDNEWKDILLGLGN